MVALVAGLRADGRLELDPAVTFLVADNRQQEERRMPSKTIWIANRETT
ncbi:hypothetical protein JNW91_00200 [Micromonospora sp. STR1_7]|uniref:Transposase n=1 Tax=Micromonospora parastrephiae TaxID=2806101 RepID=A0ABS1XMI9_9ACTN|nr:hypothetical protein [Micromonospora parastrephiae]MBM0230424.1 hypothetical protein [Micromonospora parastrephiae]